MRIFHIVYGYMVVGICGRRGLFAMRGARMRKGERWCKDCLRRDRGWRSRRG